MLSLGSSDISISSFSQKYCQDSLSPDVLHSNASNMGKIVFSCLKKKAENLYLNTSLFLLVAYKNSE